jgi:hypothetical protein
MASSHPSTTAPDTRPTLDDAGGTPGRIPSERTSDVGDYVDHADRERDDGARVDLERDEKTKTP